MKNLFALLTALFFVNICQAQNYIIHNAENENTMVSGTWATGEIHVIQDNIIVEYINPFSLSIEPGVVVLFDGDFRIMTQERGNFALPNIWIDGTEEQPVLFTNSGNDPTPNSPWDYFGQWQGIGSGSSLFIDNAIFENCRGLTVGGIMQVGAAIAFGAIWGTDEGGRSIWLALTLRNVQINMWDGEGGHTDGIKIVGYNPSGEDINVFDVDLDNVSIIGAGSEGTTGLHIPSNWADETHLRGDIDNVTISGFENGMYFNVPWATEVGAGDLNISDCEINGVPDESVYGIFLDNSIVGALYEHVIDNVKIKDFLYGIYSIAQYDNVGNLLLRNNTIRDVGIGILIDADDDYNSEERPYIYNNQIFNYYDERIEANDAPFDICSGISIVVEDQSNEEELEICNNVCWGDLSVQNGITLTASTGDEMNELDDHVWISNNILGQNANYGLFIDGNLDAGHAANIRLNAFKNNLHDYSSDFAELEEVTAESNFNGDFHLVDENPESDDYDFRLLVLGFMVHRMIQGVFYFDNLCVTAFSDYENIEEFGFPSGFDWLEDGQDRDNSCADIGAFGGQYANQFTDYGNNHYTVLALAENVDCEVVEDRDDYYWFIECLNIDINGSIIFLCEEGSRFVTNGYGINVDGAFSVIADVGSPCIFESPPGENWNGILYSSTANFNDSELNNCEIYDASFAVKINGYNTLNTRGLPISNCLISDCGTGIYINNSKALIEDTEITGSDDGYNGNAIYLINCSAGKVIIDGCDIHDNGVGGDYTDAAIYCNASSPEIINTTIENNTGCGIACISSSPDLNTWDYSGNKFNDIHANGSGTQSGSSGAEIYLASSSYPSIKYNNIWDYDTGPIGIMVYKDYSSNSGALTATDNWWGCMAPVDSFFYWGLGSAIDYSNYSSSQLSSFEEYELAMGYWDEGEYEDAARILRRTVLDDGAVGVNSVHYLAGCVGEMENGNFLQLRTFLQDVAAEHEDEEVAKVANRFATHCLTERCEYDGAMEEYDYARNHADCLRDSVEAVIDYLAVCELAGDGDLDAAAGDIPTQMHNMMELLKERTAEGSTDILLPEDFMVVEAYPNPFNSTTTIAYNLSTTGEVKLSIHDLQGRLISVLQDGVQTAGYKKAVWNAGDQPSGLYLCRMESKGKIATAKLTLVK